MPAVGFGDIGADVRGASAACAASQSELHGVADAIAAQICRLQLVQVQVAALTARLEERLAMVRDVVRPAA